MAELFVLVKGFLVEDHANEDLEYYFDQRFDFEYHAAHGVTGMLAIISWEFRQGERHVRFRAIKKALKHAFRF